MDMYLGSEEEIAQRRRRVEMMMRDAKRWHDLYRIPASQRSDEETQELAKLIETLEQRIQTDAPWLAWLRERLGAGTNLADFIGLRQLERNAP